MNAHASEDNRSARQGGRLGWARIWAGLGQLALYLSLLACLWVVLVAIGLALCRRKECGQLDTVYKPIY